MRTDDSVEAVIEGFAGLIPFDWEGASGRRCLTER